MYVDKPYVKKYVTSSAASHAALVYVTCGRLRRIVVDRHEGGSVRWLRASSFWLGFMYA